MVDRAGRDRMAELLRQFVDCRMTNDDFDDAAGEIAYSAIGRGDPGLGAIRTRGWFLYDDLHQHRLVGRWAVKPEGKHEIARWIVFLHTDLEYEWPVSDFKLSGVAGCFLSILTLGLWGLLRRREMQQAGDTTVWPFIRREDYEAALQNPRLLAGGGTGADQASREADR